MSTQLEAGIREAKEWLEAKYDTELVPFYEKGRWNFPANPELVKAAVASFEESNAYPTDIRGLTYSYAYVGIKRLGTGQFYLIAIKDKDGNAFDGGKTYRLNVPANVPVEQYWSLTAYDRETYALIRNMPRASRSSQVTELVRNEDGSVDLFLGPEAPQGKDALCAKIQTKCYPGLNEEPAQRGSHQLGHSSFHTTGIVEMDKAGFAAEGLITRVSRFRLYEILMSQGRVPDRSLMRFSLSIWAP